MYRLTALCGALACAVCLLAVAAAPASAGNGGVCFECDQPDEPERPADYGEVLSLRELRALTREVGFRRPRLAAAIAMAESSGHVRARNRNRRRHRSIDRGLFQINSHWHPEVSKRCAFDAWCNAEAAHRISNGGRDWRQWTTWHSGAYRPYI